MVWIIYSMFYNQEKVYDAKKREQKWGKVGSERKGIKLIWKMF